MIELFAYAALTFVFGFVIVAAWSVLTFELDFRIDEEDEDEW